MVLRLRWLALVLVLVAAGCIDQGSESGPVTACPCEEPWSVVHNPSDFLDIPYAVVVDDGAVYVGGTDEVKGTGDDQWRIEKYAKDSGRNLWTKTKNPSGTPEGRSDAWDHLYDMDIDSDSLYLAGVDSTVWGRYSFRVEKRSARTGALQWAVSDDPGGIGAGASAIEAHGDSVYVAGAQSSRQTTAHWRIERRDAKSGDLLWQVLRSHNGTSGTVNEMVLFEDHLYVVGFTAMNNGWSWVIEKRHVKDGSLVWSVDNGPPSYPYTLLEDIAVDETGIYVAGTKGFGDPPDLNYKMLTQKHSLGDGRLLWQELSDANQEHDSAWALALDEDFVYVAGSGVVPDPAGQPSHDTFYRIEKREKRKGALEWDSDYNPSTFHDEPFDIAADYNCLFVIGTDSSELVGDGFPDYQWRIDAMEK